MQVLILPVSGGGLVSQLAAIQLLCEACYVPRVTLSSSGGNVAAYIAAAANWKWAAVKRLSAEINSKILFTPWYSISSLALIVGYFKGEVYNHGIGVNPFMHKYFSNESIIKYEIWTGTYNKTKRLTQFFCNRSKETAIINTDLIDKNLHQMLPPVYADGDIDLISKACMASASIPALVPGQVYEGDIYVDGGVASASPISLMQDPLIIYADEHDLPLHLTYVNSENLANPNKVSSAVANMMETWQQAALDILRAQAVLDRLAAYRMISGYNGGKKLEQDDFPCTNKTLKIVNEIRSHLRYTLLEIYPEEYYSVDVTKFTGDDIVNMINKVTPRLRCRFWWFLPTNTDVLEKVVYLLEECKKIEPTEPIYIGDDGV